MIDEEGLICLTGNRGFLLEFGKQFKHLEGV